MKRPEREPLLNEVLEGDDLSQLRRTTLESGLAAVRARRRRRYAAQICALASLPLAAFLVFLHLRSAGPGLPKRSVNPEALADSTTSTGTNAVRLITDEELFALFPNRPMALVGKPGSQELVFLDRPDAARQP